MKSESTDRLLPEALRCPVTGGRLEFEPDGQWVRVIGHPLRYPVRGGIPVLVTGAAQQVDSGSTPSD